MSTALHQRITEREERLAALRQDVMILEAEIRAYRDALSLMESVPLEPSASRKQTRHDDADTSDGRAGRGLSQIWQQIWTSVGLRYPNQFSIDDIFTVTQTVDPKINRDNVRSQAWTREQHKDLERITPGVYVMTDQGRERFSVQPLLPNPTQERAVGLFCEEEDAA